MPSPINEDLTARTPKILRMMEQRLEFIYRFYLHNDAPGRSAGVPE